MPRWIVVCHDFNSFGIDVTDTWPENKAYLIKDTKHDYCVSGLRFKTLKKAEIMCKNMNEREKDVDKMFERRIQQSRNWRRDGIIQEQRTGQKSS